MRATVDREAFARAVAIVSSVIKSRSPRPQLMCVHISAKSGKGGGLRLSATDGESAMRVNVPQVDVIEPGDILIPAQRLGQILGAESDTTVVLETIENDAVMIRTSRSAYKIFGYPPVEFPPILDFEKIATGDGVVRKGVLTITAKQLMRMLRQTYFCIARENSRYAINGILFCRNPKNLELVATDGRRLAWVYEPVQRVGDTDKEFKVIAAGNTIGALLKMLDEGEQTVRIGVTDSQIAFEIERPDAKELLVSSLVEGTFPPYEDVVPHNQDRSVTFQREEAITYVGRAALLTNEETRGVRFDFKMAEKKAVISSRAPEIGESQVDMDLTEATGGNIEIGFNPTFLNDALRVLDSVQVTLHLAASNKPGLIKQDQFLYVIMPVNLA